MQQHNTMVTHSVDYYVKKWSDKYIIHCLSYSKTNKLHCLSNSFLNFSQKKQLLDNIYIDKYDSSKQKLRYSNQKKAFEIVYSLFLKTINKLHNQNQNGGDGEINNQDKLHSIITHITQHDDIHEQIAQNTGLKKQYIKEIANRIGDAIAKSLTINLLTPNKK